MLKLYYFNSSLLSPQDHKPIRNITGIYQEQPSQSYGYYYNKVTAEEPKLQLGMQPAVPWTAQHTARVPTSDSDSPHLVGTHLCLVVLTTEPPHQDAGQPHSHRVSASPSKAVLEMQYPCLGCWCFQSPKEELGSFKEFLLVLTPNSSQPQV